MDKVNPFKPGWGQSPPHLAGREAEQRQMATVLQKMQESGEGEAMVLYGPRGTGKTALLKWLRRQCRDAGVMAITATPAMGLASLEDLSRTLLPKTWRPDSMSLGVKGLFSAGWGMPDAGAGGRLRRKLAKACRRTPRALLLDEAHTLDADVCRSLLSLIQDIYDEVPFTLVMAGTPGLVPYLLSVGATFVERSMKLGIGRLGRQSAADAIRVPLQADGIAIDGDALARVVEDAQRYPYFLQLWGLRLWALAKQQSLMSLAEAEVDAVMPTIADEREGFYNNRYDLLEEDEPLLHAAYAVACAFEGKAGLHKDDIPEVIGVSLTDKIADANARWEEARRLSRALNRMDFVWRPSKSPEVEPGIPSFMSHVRHRVERSWRQGRGAVQERVVDDDMGLGMQEPPENSN